MEMKDNNNPNKTYKTRKEICLNTDKVLKKDNPEVVGTHKYYLVMY
jgi:hypothetical protein